MPTVNDSPADDAPVPEPAQTREETRKPKLARPAQLAIVTVLILGALAGIFFTGRIAVTGLDSSSENLPDSVDRLIPGSGQQVLRQSQVGIDVADGYDAYLQVNGVTISTAAEGLIKDGTGLVQFQPGPPSETAPDRPIETLNQGQNCVTAFVWDQLEGQATAEPVAWCFNAT